MEKLPVTFLNSLDVADCNSGLLGRVSMKSTVTSGFGILHCHVSCYWFTGHDWTPCADTPEQRFCTQGDQIVILHTSVQHFPQLPFLRHVPITKERGS